MQKPFSTASGNMLADRRADYAEMLFGSGEAAPAAELMLGALEIAPGWAMGWFRLGEFHEAAGAIAQATQAWRMAERLDPADRAGAALKLALAGASAPVARPPSAFVETLFDQYAGTFDQALVGTLDYRVPQLLADAISRQASGRFGLAVDLGCGTGLMGERLRERCDRLVGHDISAGMLRKARAKGVYDELVKADLQSFAYDGDKADLVTAADVFMYVGALEGIVAAVAKMLAPGGLFAFSVEQLSPIEPGATPAQEAGDATGFALQPSRRYAHGETYVRSLLDRNAFRILSLQTETIRMDRRKPVHGMIVVACKT